MYEQLYDCYLLGIYLASEKMLIIKIFGVVDMFYIYRYIYLLVVLVLFIE